MFIHNISDQFSLVSLESSPLYWSFPSVGWRKYSGYFMTNGWIVPMFVLIFPYVPCKCMAYLPTSLVFFGGKYCYTIPAPRSIGLTVWSSEQNMWAVFSVILPNFSTCRQSWDSHGICYIRLYHIQSRINTKPPLFMVACGETPQSWYTSHHPVVMDDVGTCLVTSAGGYTTHLVGKLKFVAPTGSPWCGCP